MVIDSFTLTTILVNRLRWTSAMHSAESSYDFHNNAAASNASFCLKIMNLPEDISVPELQYLLPNSGILSIEIKSMTHYPDPMHEGSENYDMPHFQRAPYALVQFADPSSAANALKQFDGMYMRGHQIM